MILMPALLFIEAAGGIQVYARPPVSLHGAIYEIHLQKKRGTAPAVPLHGQE
jgi:hypothetical protein